MQEIKVELPQFVIDSELSKTLKELLPAYLKLELTEVIFDWSKVCFFDDYTLLKLIVIQRSMRLRGCRLCNRGFIFVLQDKNKQAVIRQLWKVGLADIIASDYLLKGLQLKEALEDEKEFLMSDPLLGLQTASTSKSVIPLLCCHDLRHFIAGSREEEQLDIFIRTCLSPSGTVNTAWDLIESRVFRHLMLQQLRRNVQEHSNNENTTNAIGLAIVRVWTHSSLTSEWCMSIDVKDKLLNLWGHEPIPIALQSVVDDNAILQISVIDDGPGIPANLEEVHKKLISQLPRQGQFLATDRLHYDNKEFDKRFIEPASWTDEKARLIAFAMDKLGTSKTDRVPEVKGLQYLRENTVIDMGGLLIIESDGTSIRNISPKHIYGEPWTHELKWCQNGGTGACLVVPMKPTMKLDDYSIEAHSVGKRNIFRDQAVKSEIIKVRDYLNIKPTNTKTNIQTSDIVACAKKVVNRIKLPEGEYTAQYLRSRKLVIVDWMELPDSKRVIHYLLVAIAKGLSEIDTQLTRPFVFANLPLGLCGILGRAISMYSKEENPNPICVFAIEKLEPFWLGIDDTSHVHEDLRKCITIKARLKITDQRENHIEAFYRECFTQLLSQVEPVSLSSNYILSCVRNEKRRDVTQTLAYARFKSLVLRCALFREEMVKSHENKMVYTARFGPIFSIDEIIAEVRELFLEKFRDKFTQEPICFMPKDPTEGIILPHSSRVVERYFRSDALIDSPIAMELTQELIDIARNIAKYMPGERIDWVVTCTSPLQWFVHKIVDGLLDSGMICSHHVFTSYDAIIDTIDEIGMRPNESVLVFTDVIATGQTAFRIAESLITNYNVKMAGLITLADIRTTEDRKNGPDLDRVYNGTIVCLYNKPEPDRINDGPNGPKLTPAYYVHPETVVPKRVARTSPAEEFFEKNYTGTGTLINKHTYFWSPKRFLNLMTTLDAIHFGHYQHGSHHSEVFVDVDKILHCREFRNLVVTTLFKYIVDNEIRLVLYPSHSSIYILADELRQRFTYGESSVEFIMACRTFKGTQGTSYALTRFSPYPEPQWEKYSNNAVLILDDAVCTGATVQSIMAELSRVDRNYYEGKQTFETASEHKFAVHVIALLNRLPRVTGDFWSGLSRITIGQVQFSAFVSMPLAVDSPELCLQCRREKKLHYLLDSDLYSHYAREFLSWLISQNVVVSSRERRHSKKSKTKRFTSKEALHIAGYISAIERNGYLNICGKLFDGQENSDKENTRSLRIHVRSRAAFIHNLFPNKSGDSIDDLCKELEALIGMALAESNTQKSYEEILEILKFLTYRYIRMRPKREEIEQITNSLFMGLALKFDNRLIVGGVAAILDSCLKWFSPSAYNRNDLEELKRALRDKIVTIERTTLSSSSKLTVDWFTTYLSEDGKGIDSIGQAVLMLAKYAKQGKPNHFYGRHELDALRVLCNNPFKANVDEAEEIVRRVLVCTKHFMNMVRATRVLSSASLLEEQELNILQDGTIQCVQKMIKACTETLKEDNDTEGLENYKTVKFLYLKLCDNWFPAGVAPKATVVIGNFTPYLKECIDSSWNSYEPKRRCKELFKFDISALEKHSTMMVLVDPGVLTTTMHQLFDNVDKYADKDTEVNVACTVCIPDSQLINNNSGQVEVIVSNSGTPRPNISEIKTRGLSAVRMHLLEYGGGVDYKIPKSDWSFEVTLKLLIWTEKI